jgi:hypothetical protein
MHALGRRFSKLFALKLVSNFECANFQNFRPWVARSGLGVVFIFADYKTCNFILYFKDPAIPVLLSALIEPLIEPGIICPQAGENGVVLLDLIGLALYHVWQADRLLRECLLEPLQRFLDGQDARAQTGSLGPPVNANVLL